MRLNAHILRLNFYVTWLRELKPLHPGYATDRDLQILSVLQKSKQLVFEKMFLRRLLFYVMITNEVPVTILQAFFSFPRHIREGMLIRRIITSDLCTAVGCQQFCNESRKLRKRISLNVITPFIIIVVVLQLRSVPKTEI